MRTCNKMLPLLLCFLAGCRDLATEDAQPDDDARPASVARSVRLKAEAQAAIGIETAATTSQSLRNAMQTTGWTMPIPGNETMIKARGTGFYQTNPETSKLALGANVSTGQRLGSLRTVLSPQEETQLVIAKEEADVLMNQALVSKHLAENQLRNIEESNANNAVSGTRLLELREIIARNDSAYKEASDRLSFLPDEPYAEQLFLRSIPIDSPLTGQISAVNVVPNQLVLQGDPLCAVSDWSQLWIKVAVFGEDLPRVLPGEAALVNLPGSPTVVEAQPVNVVIPSDPGRRTTDLFYLIENRDGKIRAGQAFSIRLPMGETRAQIVIPRSAIVWDGMGNTWAYVKSGAETFVRRRVELGQGYQDSVSIQQGLIAGEEIVILGAQSLYGEEFKSQLQAEDDD